MNNPLISIIIPIYNVEKFLPKCLDSVIKQTYQNIEILLVDDGSPDNCGAICDDYAEKDNRIVVIHKMNEGVNEARITGFNASKGEYITFVDPDDYVSPLYVERLYYPISCKDVVMSCVQWVYVLDNNKTIYDIRTRFGYFDKQGIEGILKTDFLYDRKKNTNAYNLGLCCKMIKREYLYGAMEKARGLWMGEDLIANLWILYHVPTIYILDEYLYYYVQHNSQSSRKGDLRSWYNEVEQWNRIVELDRNHYLTDQLPYRILLQTKILVRNNVEQENITPSVFANKMDNALQVDIVHKNLFDYHFVSLNTFYKFFLFLLKNKRYYFLYYFFKIGLPIHRFLRSIFKKK